MLELVIRHLNRNYYFSLSTMVSFYRVIDIIKLAFDITHEEAYGIFDEYEVMR